MNNYKYVYFFGDGKADGTAGMKNLLGGKGANLAEMSNIGLPVPPGFTITTEVCTYYYQHERTYPEELKPQVEEAIKNVEEILGKKFADSENTLLFSVRSGARISMPGMMETVLNVGLTSDTIPGLIKQTKNERFVYDSYRRLISMYSDVVMEKAMGIRPKEGQGVRHQLERLLENVKKKNGYKNDTDLTADDLKELTEQMKLKVEEVLGEAFPDNPHDQLWGGISAVFQSWNGKRAKSYRKIEGIPEEWGTAVNVQAMVFGNTGDRSATGVAFTRDPATGENQFYGEWLINAQGEDVVAGIRTPFALNNRAKQDFNKHLPSLEEKMPEVYQKLSDIRDKLERHYKDMQDLEFTIEDGKLWMLQTRVGKRNGIAALRMAVEMQREGLIPKEDAVLRVKPSQLDELLHPMVDPKLESSHTPIGKGLPAGPGGANGKIVFTADSAEELGTKGEKVILVRDETSPEDVHGMKPAQAILTSKGGMTSHAALVARGWGKCCVVGCGDLRIDMENKKATFGDKVLKEGDWITLNGTKGLVYEGELPLVAIDPEQNEHYKQMLNWADQLRRLKVRTNTDTPADTKKALEFGAEGIGLFRIEHMFYGENSEEPLFILRKMIMSNSEKERRAVLDELFPYMKSDIKSTLSVMDGYPVTVRLLDPPLHEFVPKQASGREKLARELRIDTDELKQRFENLHESNPMMGHRGVRLGVTYPEITETQVQAILEAAAELTQEGKTVYPEIMIPVLGHVNELRHQKNIVERVYQRVLEKYNLDKLDHLVGTMIEIPRACLTADQIAEVAEFFSFGTNDLTQMGFGFSRDDIGGFLVHYLEQGILPDDPFQTIDQEGLGLLIKMGVEKGRNTDPKLKIGICGEHGGDPESVKFCHRVRMDYVSCSPFRVPIARLAAAQAAVEEAKMN
ncbi:pyruvate, phosphate dikinase [candidate division KSB1 bacterium]|nr:pyruvate, phosphate dikinase [candidate division KSB1 bacterium]NIR69952.1 pyruvate, phosphate dikinase [candidate division KSB1 bacterium]NIS25851.1 pyruvate, phosphate dikinase [candidate division KSB1 bacterium]NIT72728.1 pyruvate, phosphate dikinase [candidate division KSB1 bacterium]NIU26540.1 pyruvate, phosphate dikinase [candidate division KSB1 bacterium]